LFLGSLENELARRGIVPRKSLDKSCDLVYRSSSTNGSVALGILLLIPFVVGSVVVFTLSLLRRNSANRALFEAGQSATLLTKTADWTPM